MDIQLEWGSKRKETTWKIKKDTGDKR